MKKYLILSLLTLFSLKCYFAPVSQRYECETQMEGGEYQLVDNCEILLPLATIAYNDDPSKVTRVNFFQFALYQCYLELEAEEKCKKASPYIPVWPATQ